MSEIDFSKYISDPINDLKHNNPLSSLFESQSGDLLREQNDLASIKPPKVGSPEGRRELLRNLVAEVEDKHTLSGGSVRKGPSKLEGRLQGSQECSYVPGLFVNAIVYGQVSEGIVQLWQLRDNNAPSYPGFYSLWGGAANSAGQDPLAHPAILSVDSETGRIRAQISDSLSSHLEEEMHRELLEELPGLMYGELKFQGIYSVPLKEHDSVIKLRQKGYSHWLNAIYLTEALDVKEYLNGLEKTTLKLPKNSNSAKHSSEIVVGVSGEGYISHWQFNQMLTMGDHSAFPPETRTIGSYRSLSKMILSKILKGNG